MAVDAYVIRRIRPLLPATLLAAKPKKAPGVGAPSPRAWREFGGGVAGAHTVVRKTRRSNPLTAPTALNTPDLEFPRRTLLGSCVGRPPFQSSGLRRDRSENRDQPCALILDFRPFDMEAICHRIHKIRAHSPPTDECACNRAASGSTEEKTRGANALRTILWPPAVLHAEVLALCPPLFVLNQ